MPQRHWIVVMLLLAHLVAGLGLESRPAAAAPAPYLIIPVGTFGGSGHASANAVNAEGQVVGSTPSYSGATRPYLWEYSWISGRVTDLGTPPGFNNGYALGLNSSGQVVGYVASTEAQKRAFYHDAGGTREIGTLGGPIASPTRSTLQAGPSAMPIPKMVSTVMPSSTATAQ